MNTMIFNALDEFNTNPFGLKDQTKEWLVKKLQDGGHHPLRFGARHEGIIPEAPFSRVFTKYHRHSDLEHAEKMAKFLILDLLLLQT